MNFTTHKFDNRNVPVPEAYNVRDKEARTQVVRRKSVLALIVAMVFAVAVSHAEREADHEPLCEFEPSSSSEPYRKAGQAFDKFEFESAAAFFRQVIADPNETYWRFRAQIHLATSLNNLKRYEEAEKEICAALKEAEQLNNVGTGIITKGHTLLARILSRQGKHRDAEQEYRSYLKAMEVNGDGNTGNIEEVRKALVNFLRTQSRYTDVVAELRLLVKAGPQTVDTRNVWSWKVRQDLAEALVLSGKQEEGIKEARETLHGFHHLDGNNEEDMLKTRKTIADGYMRLRKFSEAEGQFRIILEARTSSLGNMRRDSIRALFELATCLKAQKKFDGALVVAKRTLSMSHQVLGAEHPDTKEYEKFLSELPR